jgi:ribonuclease HI
LTWISAIFVRFDFIEMAKNKFYVVWSGRKCGVFPSWEECKEQILAFPNAQYKSFPTKQEAEKAFNEEYKNFIKSKNNNTQKGWQAAQEKPNILSLAVDAACSGNPGKMEYRGVMIDTNKEIFRVGPLDDATNNIGEFLAIVHGLALLKQQQLNLPIYSDSRNAISWVKQKKCKTKLQPSEKNQRTFELIARAEKWLNENDYSTQIYKWDTANWGEIPADFGRK